jgi:N-acetylmuramoyl-L-alanine amidase
MQTIGPVQWLFLHTAAFTRPAGVKEIRAWHLARGWSDIGYHWVIRKSGDIEVGRSHAYAGAHVAGANSRSLGICMEGHGDYEPWTLKQGTALGEFAVDLMARYEIPARNVLGHREVNRLIDVGEVGDQYRTSKSCPGGMIDMDVVRGWLALAADPDLTPEMARAQFTRRTL